MGSVWTGSMEFGVVNVPVKAYGATGDHDVDLHQVHDADGGLIRYERRCGRCGVCGKHAGFDHIDKAFDEGERTVVLSDEDRDTLPAEQGCEIDVLQFVPGGQPNPLMFERSYHLEPDSESAKANLLLRGTLENTVLTAIVELALRQKTRLGVLRVRDGLLALQGTLWADEVRDPDSIDAPSKTRISAKELKMSSALVEQFHADVTPQGFQEEYQPELRKLIEEKLKHRESVDTAATFGADTSGT